MEKLNIAELLRDCPTGMELDSTLFEGLEFDCIVDNEYLPIRCRIKHPNGGYTVYNFTKYGCWLDTTFAKCVIFPKGKTTWEGFQRPFKDGDVVSVTMIPEGIWIGIFKQHEETSFKSYCYLNTCGEFCSTGSKKHSLKGIHLATEEEKEKLFQAIKDNGYKWNAETKTLERLIVPKFKVGDRVKTIYKDYQYDIKEITDTHYTLVEVINKFQYTEPITEDKNWELVPNKYDITTLKPFESRVLVRDVVHNEWEGAIFGRYDGKTFFTIGGLDWKHCIPYEGNKHLLGTTDDCDEYYKTWE